MHRKSLPLLIMLAVVAFTPTVALAASAPVKDLPGVENESASTAAPIITGEQVQRTGVPRANESAAAPAAAAAEAVPAAPAIRFESQGEARDKIRRAYLLQRYDEVVRLGRAALNEWPEDAAFQYYVKAAEEKLNQPRKVPEKESAYQRMRDKNRDQDIKAMLSGVRPERAVKTPAGAAVDPGADKTPDAAATKAPVKPVQNRAPLEPPVEPASAGSGLAKIKAQFGNPIALGAIGGIVVLGLVVVVLLRRKPAAKQKGESEFKPESKKDKIKSKTVLAEEVAEPLAPAASPFAESDDLDSLFKPAAPQPVAVNSQETSLDELFGAPSEPTIVSPPPTPAPAPEPEPEITLDAFADITPEPAQVGAPIRLDEPIELPTLKSPAPAESPFVIPDIVEPEPISLSSPEPIPAINIAIPEEDPFYKGADRIEPAMIEMSPLDLPSIEETVDQPTSSSVPDNFFQPIMPDILESPSSQPELANTDTNILLQPFTPVSFEPDLNEQTIAQDLNEETITQFPSEETLSAEADLPTIDTEPSFSVHRDETLMLDPEPVIETPSVSVHRDETLALKEEAREIVQETAVSPSIPAPSPELEVKPSAGDDLFSREFQKGMNDFSAENWAGAVYHLSIAAALKPASADVKEKLREARRRRKETNGA